MKNRFLLSEGNYFYFGSNPKNVFVKAWKYEFIPFGEVILNKNT